MSEEFIKTLNVSMRHNRNWCAIYDELDLENISQVAVTNLFNIHAECCMSVFKFIKENAKSKSLLKITNEVINYPETACKIIREITYIKLSGCGINNESFSEDFHLISNLHTLNLSTNELTSVPRSILNMHNLKVLMLNGNKITTLPDEIAKMQKLNRLDILENPIKSVSEHLGHIIVELPFLARWSCCVEQREQKQI